MMLGLVCIAACAATEATLPEIELVATPGWREAAMVAPPLSMLRDPAAAATVAHVRGQLATMDDAQAATSTLPSLMLVLEHLDGLVLHAARRAGEHFDWFQEGSALVTDCGVAVPGINQWMDTLLVDVGQRAHWEAYAGFALDSGVFIGCAGQRVVLGQVENLVEPVRVLERLVAAPADPRISMTWRLERRLKDLATQSVELPMRMVFDEFFGSWKDTKPIVQVCLATAPDGWHGDVIVNDVARLPLGNLEAQVAAAARSGYWLTLGMHVDPNSVQRMLHALDLPYADVVGQLTLHLTGDYLLQMKGGAGPVPQGAVLLTVHDGNEVAALLSEYAHHNGMAEIVRQDADQAFAEITLTGTIFYARRGERLVIGNDEALLSQWLAGNPGDAPIIDPGVVHLDLELPAIAQQWLPMAWAILSSMHTSLSEDPLGILDSMSVEVRGGLRRLALPTSVSEALSLDMPELRVGWSALGRIFVGADMAAAIDAACTIYVPDPPRPPNEEGMPLARLVLRFSDGYAIFEEEGRQTALDATALDTQLQGWKRLLGPDPAVLPQVPMPEPAVFDARWLPPLAVALRHIPAYHLTVSATDFSLRVVESGLPLACLATIAVALKIAD